MQATNKKVNIFLKSYPKCKTFLEDLLKKEENKINKEIEDEDKEELVENAKNKFEYDIKNFKNTSSESFNYKLKSLNNDDSDYKVLESTFSLNDQAKGVPSLNDFMDQLVSNNEKQNKSFKIYKVIPTDTTSTEPNTSNCSKVHLLHGTKSQNVEGILRTGFKPSKSGLYGPGVYLTNSVEVAHRYGTCFAQEKGIVKKFRYLFVNKVDCTNVLSPKNVFDNPKSYKEYLNKKPVVQIFSAHTQISTRFEDSTSNKYDSSQVKILQGTFERDVEKEKIVLSHDTFVVPAYLIEIEEKQTVDQIVEEILYNDLKLERFTRNSEPSTKYQKKNRVKETSKQNQESTSDKVSKALVKEINANRQAKLEILWSKHDNYMESIMEQLSFKIRSIIETTKKEKVKYQAEILKTEDDGYKFILRSVENNKNAINKKVLHVLKIKSVNKRKDDQLKGEYLFFNGIKSNKVTNILTSGYPSGGNVDMNFNKRVSQRMQGIRDITAQDNDTYKATLCLEDEICKGSSYYEDDNVVKELFFVFVATSRFGSHDPIVDTEVDTDTRGSCFNVKQMRSRKRNLRKPCIIPAYLIIFDVNNNS